MLPRSTILEADTKWSAAQVYCHSFRRAMDLGKAIPGFKRAVAVSSVGAALPWGAPSSAMRKRGWCMSRPRMPALCSLLKAYVLLQILEVVWAPAHGCKGLKIASAVLLTRECLIAYPSSGDTARVSAQAAIAARTPPAFIMRLPAMPKPASSTWCALDLAGHRTAGCVASQAALCMNVN